MAIAIVPSSPASNNFSGVVSSSVVTLGATVGAGNCIVVVIIYAAANTTPIATVTDNGSGGSAAYSLIKKATQGSGASGVTVEEWSTTATGSKASTTQVTASFGTNVTATGNVNVAAYSGVGSIGTSTQNGVSANTTPTITQALNATGNYLVAGIGNNGTSATMTAQNGTIRKQSDVGLVLGGLVDNTGALSVTDSVTVTNSSTWMCIAVELKLPSAAYLGLGTSMGSMM